MNSKDMQMTEKEVLTKILNEAASLYEFVHDKEDIRIRNAFFELTGFIRGMCELHGYTEGQNET